MKKRVAIIVSAAAVTIAAAWASPPRYEYEGQWGEMGTGNGQFDFPFAVGVASGGNVYVSDHYNDRVQYFTATGTYLGKWGRAGSRNGDFRRPAGLEVAADGTSQRIIEKGGVG